MPLENNTQKLKSTRQKQYVVERIQGDALTARVKDKQDFICSPRAPVKILEYLDQQCEEYVQDELAVGDAKKSNQRPFLRHPPPCVFLPFLRRRREHTGMYTVEKVKREAESLTYCLKKISPALNDTFHKACYKHTPVHNNSIWEVSAVEKEKKTPISPKPSNIRTVTVINESPVHNPSSFKDKEISTIHYRVTNDNAYCNELSQQNMNCHLMDHYAVDSLCDTPGSRKICQCHEDCTTTDKNTHVYVEKCRKPSPTIVSISQCQKCPSPYIKDNMNESAPGSRFDCHSTQHQRMDSCNMHSNGSITECHVSQNQLSPTVCICDTQPSSKSRQLAQGTCACDNVSSTKRNEHSTCREMKNCCHNIHSRACHKEQECTKPQDALNDNALTALDNRLRYAPEEQRIMPSTYTKSCCCHKNEYAPLQTVEQQKCSEKDNSSLCSHGFSKFAHPASCMEFKNVCHEECQQERLQSFNENYPYTANERIHRPDGSTKNTSSYTVVSNREDHLNPLVQTHISSKEPMRCKYTTSNLVCSRKVEEPRTVYICEKSGPSSQCSSDEKSGATFHVYSTSTPSYKLSDTNIAQVQATQEHQGVHVSCHPTITSVNRFQSPKTSMHKRTARSGLTHLRKWEVIGPFC
ncbi:uncharacterized protein LOC128883694 [Hylaeus volcanicus]|uniref:uncharacterized protein LOC128883694 n=1 Tax=Hylaeus volcanicus TaxID=313075 RepID=UPI0023B862F6|nr:uncharacterized protein LOC128883694 [Hylaeus volcanicus]